MNGGNVSSSDSRQANSIENSLAHENSDSRYKFPSLHSGNSLELTEFSLHTNHDECSMLVNHRRRKAVFLFTSLCQSLSYNEIWNWKVY